LELLARLELLVRLELLGRLVLLGPMGLLARRFDRLSTAPIDPWLRRLRRPRSLGG